MKRQPSPTRRALRALGMASAAILAAAVALSAGGIGPLRVNFTSSLPRGLYRIRPGGPSRGVLVIACLPADAGRFAHERGYLWRGDCPGGAAPIGKRVSAVAGDTVRVSAAGLTVNHKPIPNTQMLARDSRGLALAHVPYGVYPLARGELWLASSFNQRSYDSRYFGPIQTTAVLSRIEPLLTIGAPP